MMGTLPGKADWFATMEGAGVPMFNDVEEMAEAAGLLARYPKLRALASVATTLSDVSFFSRPSWPLNFAFCLRPNTRLLHGCCIFATFYGLVDTPWPVSRKQGRRVGLWPWVRSVNSLIALRDTVFGLMDSGRADGVHDARSTRQALGDGPKPATAIIAITSLQLLSAAESVAQVKAPSKNTLKAPAKSAPSLLSEDVQPFSIGTDGTVVQQLINLKIDPADAQSAADAVGKALGQPDVKAASSGRAILQSQGPNQPKRLVSLQLFSAKSLAVEVHRGADGSYGYKLAPNATEQDDERVSSVPSMTTAAGPARGRSWPARSAS